MSEGKHRGFIAWFCHNGVAANLMMITIIVLGVGSLMTRLPVEIFPRAEPLMISVMVPYRGSTPKEVEKGVSILVEESLEGLEGIERVQSQSMENMASISIEVNEAYDPREVLDDVKNRIDAINNFPPEIERPVISLLQFTRAVITVVVSGGLDERGMRRLGEEIRDDLLAEPGITQVKLAGSRPYEIAIEVDEDTLQSYQLTLTDVVRAVRGASLDLAAGQLRTESGDILIRTSSQAYTGAEFARLPLRATPTGAELTVGDVATIRDGFEENVVYTRYNGKPAMLIEISRTETESALDISKRVKDFVAKRNATLGNGIEISYWRDSARTLRLRTKSLVSSLTFALLIVGGILALFLDIRLAFWVCFGIVVCFCGTWMIMPMLGGTINLISLFAFILVLGIVVDDAIVTGENVYRKLSDGLPGESASIVGTQEIARPVTFGILTTIAAFIPLAMVPGFMGTWIRQIPIVVVPVLLFSLLESKLILPSHLKHIRMRKANNGGGRINPFVRFKAAFQLWFDQMVSTVYQPLLRFCLNWRYATVAMFVVIGFVTIACMIVGLKRAMFPDIDSERITMNLEMPVGTPFSQTEAHILRIVEEAEKMRNRPDYNDDEVGPIIENVMYMVGSGGRSSSRGGSPHLGEVIMEVREPESRTNTRTIRTRNMAREWREAIGSIPGAKELSFRSQIGRSRAPVDVQLTGPSFEDLAQAEEEVRELLATYAGLFNITTTFEPGKEEVRVKLKPEARQLGITEENLARQVRTAFFGAEVQRIQRGRDDLRVMVRYPIEKRRSLHTLETMFIRTPAGDPVPFSTVAEASMKRGYTTIRRSDRGRALSVLADADKKTTDVEEVLKDLEQQLPTILGRYPGMRYTFEGDARDGRKTSRAFLFGSIVALFFIYALLAVPFRSYSQPFIVMLVIPFGVVGALLGHFIMGLDQFSIMSQYGILALFGVVVNDSLVLVDYVNQKRKSGVPLYDAVTTAGLARFRPILLTSLTTFGGLIPTMFEKSTQAQFLVPMAVSLGWGILFATVVTLILVPVNYMILEDIRHGLRALWNWWWRPFQREETAGT